MLSYALLLIAAAAVGFGVQKRLRELRRQRQMRRIIERSRREGIAAATRYHRET